MAILCAALVASPGIYAQNLADRQPRFQGDTHWYSPFINNYRPTTAPPINVSNSGRIDSLIRAGTLYLSLNDAIALALENNIDVEVQRYSFLINGSQVRSAEAGPNGSWDPTLTSNFNWQHSSSPSTNAVTSGGLAVNINDGRTRNFGIQQSFKTGGNLTLGFNNSTSRPNNPNTTFLPSYQSSLQLQGTQPLLQGFGLAFNTRNIRVAKNNLKMTDFQFEQTLNTTLASVIQQYWNLVSARMAVDVAQKTLDLNQTQLDNNNKQVEIGTMAPLDALQSRQSVETSRVNLIRAQGTLTQQETTLKNLLSRNGISSATLADLHIVPTDTITIPDVEPVQPIQDLEGTALDHRPEVAQQRLSLENSKINLTGTRNSMLPTLSLTGNVSNPTSGGPLNPSYSNPFAQPGDPNKGVNPEFIGGYGNILNHIFSSPNVNYSIGFTLNINLRNRAEQEAYIQQDLAYRQNELSLQKQINQIRVDVQNAQTAVTNARAQYQAAVVARDISRQVYEAEQQKYALGASTTYLVTQHLNDLTNAEQNLLTAQTAYAQAKLQLDQATGMILDHHNVQLDEAKNGRVSRPPDPIPPNAGNANVAPPAGPRVGPQTPQIAPPAGQGNAAIILPGTLAVANR
jgi:outer membrane protein